MKTYDYVRLVLMAVLIVIIFRHAHWSVGVFVVLVTYERELMVYTLRRGRKTLRDVFPEVFEAFDKSKV